MSDIEIIDDFTTADDVSLDTQKVEEFVKSHLSDDEILLIDKTFIINEE